MASQGSYPHPVLGHADDVDSEFRINSATVSATQEDVEVRMQIVAGDTDLVQLVDSGFARYSLRWTCSSTISTGEMQPETIRTNSDGLTQVFSIDQQTLRGEVSVELRVVAVKPIPLFRWTRQNPEYGNAHFNISTGDVIADAGSFKFDAKKRYDPLSPPVGSCFKFIADTNPRAKGLHVKFDGDDEVLVRVPSKVMENLQHFSGWPDLQIATLVLPALMETLSFMKANDESGEEDLEGRRWFVAIKTMVESNGGLEESPLHLAQKILENPVDRALRTGIALDMDGN